MKCFKITGVGVFTKIFAIFVLLYSSRAFSITVPDASTMLMNLKDQIPSLISLVTALAYVMGFFFTYKGLIELKKFGEQRTMMGGEHHLSGPLIYLFVGAMLIYLPSSVYTGLHTIWGVNYTPYAYDTQSGDAFSIMQDTVFLIVQLVGVISFIRGLVLLTHIGGGHGGQPGTFGRALAHIIAGILCINLHAFVMMISTTLGISWD